MFLYARIAKKDSPHGPYRMVKRDMPAENAHNDFVESLHTSYPDYTVVTLGTHTICTMDVMINGVITHLTYFLPILGGKFETDNLIEDLWDLNESIFESWCELGEDWFVGLVVEELRWEISNQEKTHAIL